MSTRQKNFDPDDVSREAEVRGGFERIERKPSKDSRAEPRSRKVKGSFEGIHRRRNKRFTA